MHIAKGMLFLMLALATIGVAACATSGQNLPGAAVGDTGVENPAPIPPETPAPGAPVAPAVPVAPGKPVAGGDTGVVPPVPAAGALPTGPFQDLETFLAQVPPKQRLEWQDLVVACGPHPACLEELKGFEAFLREACPQQSGCMDQVAKMLYLYRSRAQRERGTYTSNYPEAQQVVAALAKANESDAGVIPEPGADTTDAALGAVVLLLKERPGTVDLPEIMGMIEQNDPTTGVVLSDKLQTVVDGATAEAFKTIATIEALRGGTSVETTAAAEALTEMTAAVKTAVVAPGGSGAAVQPPAPASPLKIALRNVITRWQEPGVPQMVTLVDLKRLLTENGAAEPMTLELENALKAIAVGSAVYPTADLLLQQKAAPKAEVFLLLQELAK